MTIINKSYQEQLYQLHHTGKFDSGHKRYSWVEELINQYQPSTLLDFGCGKGGLITAIQEHHPAISCSGYDPGNEQFNQFPNTEFDMVISTDAIEHIEPAYLNDTLSVINRLMQRCGFFRIACDPAKKFLPDGRNAHLIVESPDWWREKIQSTMNVDIAHEKISTVDKSYKWHWVKGFNYDVVLFKK